MPYMIQKDGDQFCVYKKGEDGKPTGSSKGCHDSKDDASAQMKALYAAEKKKTESLFRKFLTAFHLEPAEVGVERALASNQLFGQVLDAAYEKYPNAYLTDLYFDDGGALFAVLTEQGKLYRSDVTVSGTLVELSDWKEVATTFVDVAAPEGSETTRKQRTVLREVTVDGKKRVRWTSVSCSAVINRSGQLDSRDLFDSFIAHAEKTGEYPIRVFYHEGEKWRVGQADMLWRDGYLYLTSGLYDDSSLAQAEIKARTAEPDYWGDSIGFEPLEAPEVLTLEDGIQVPVYRKGINTEISTLPEAEAAAIFTRTIPQEVTRMTDRQLAALVKLYGGDEAAARAAIETLDPDALNRAIEEGGMLARATAPAETVAQAAPVAPALVAESVAAPAAPVTTAQPAAPAPVQAVPALPVTPAATVETTLEAPALELDDEAVREISSAVLGSETFTGLQAGMNEILAGIDELRQANAEVSARNMSVDQRLALIENRLAAVETDDDERVRSIAADMPRKRTQRVTFRPREDSEPESNVPTSLQAIADKTLAEL